MANPTTSATVAARGNNYFPQIFNTSTPFPAATKECWKKKGYKPKFVPESKTLEQLFDERGHISKGPMFEQIYGKLHDQDITISGGGGKRAPPIASSFASCGFHPSIVRNIQRCKYTTPLQVQKAVIPLIQQTQDDLIVCADNGKTAAFLLPLIDDIIKQNGGQFVGHTPYCIVCAPSHELVKQHYEDALAFSAGTDVSVAHAYGDMLMRYSLDQLRTGCAVLVCTIRRFFHYVRDNFISLDQMRFLVLDEADAFLSDDLLMNELRAIIDRRPNPRLRLLLFSTTFEMNTLQKAEEILKPNYYTVNVKPTNAVNQIVEMIRKYEKKKHLVDLLKRNSSERTCVEMKFVKYSTEKTIVFVNGDRECDRLAIALAYYGFSVITLNNSRTQKQRYAAHEDFIHDKYDILVATDLVSRGINIPNVKHVINFDMPKEGRHELYVHRIERTGRAGNIGRVTSFFDPHLDYVHAEYLFHVLEVNNQNVPEWLESHIQMNRQTRMEAASHQRLTSVWEEDDDGNGGGAGGFWGGELDGGGWGDGRQQQAVLNDNWSDDDDATLTEGFN